MNNDEERLKELRGENEEQWERLKTAATPSPSFTPCQALLIELQAVESTRTNLSLRANTHEYCREILQMHDELKHTNAVLDQRIRLAQERLASLQRWTHQQHEVQMKMSAMSAMSTLTRNTANDMETDDHAWVRNELLYVAKLIDDRSLSSEPKTKRSRGSSTQTQWTLDRFVLELLQKQRSSPMDPYLMTSHLPIAAGHVTFLLDSHVIQRHDQNEHLVCLTDYSSS